MKLKSIIYNIYIIKEENIINENPFLEGYLSRKYDFNYKSLLK